jgi:flagellin
MPNVDVTRIAGNIGALNALNSLLEINKQLATHQTRLATGRRLMEAADDPAGMSMATTFDVRRQAFKTVLNSIGDAKNLLSTAEGGLKKIQDILVKMNTKIMESQGATLGTTERQAIQNQLTAYTSEIDDIVGMTQWNGGNLIGASGVAAVSQDFLVGTDGSTATWDLGQGFSSAGTGTATSVTGLVLTDLNVTGTSTSLTNTMTIITNALTTIKAGIANVGAFTARMNFKEEAIAISLANTEAAYNRIMNANMAEEQVEASKLVILQQTATAMLAQANASPQFILSLFR